MLWRTVQSNIAQNKYIFFVILTTRLHSSVFSVPEHCIMPLSNFFLLGYCIKHRKTLYVYISVSQKFSQVHRKALISA